MCGAWLKWIELLLGIKMRLPQLLFDTSKIE